MAVVCVAPQLAEVRPTRLHGSRFRQASLEVPEAVLNGFRKPEELLPNLLGCPDLEATLAVHEYTPF